MAIHEHTTLSLERTTVEQLDRLAKQYGLTKKGLVEAMIQYFQATKADPRDHKTENPTDAIKALDRRLISFIKQQEKEQLRPIKDELVLISRKLYELDDAKTGVGKIEHLRKINERLKLVAQKVGVVD